MTDVAIDGGSAPAPAESTGAPIPTETATHSTPLGSQTPVPEKPAAPVEDKPAATAMDAIKKANDQIKARNAEKAAEVKPAPEVKAEPKAEAKPAEPKADQKPPQARGEHGHFTATEQQPAPKDAPATPAATPSEQKTQSQHREAPARFSNDAKETWANTPEPVKAEVNRAIRELEQGHQKYKADAEAYNDIREFGDLAKQHGTTIKNALTNYVGIERMLAQNPVQGFEQIISNFGWKMPDGRPMTFRDFAAQVLGQSPDEQASHQNATIQELRNEIAGLKNQLGGVTQTINSQRETAMLSQVEAFAGSHPRFDELAEAIKEEINHGYDLETAYQRAERLNPAAAPVVSQQPVIPAEKPKPPLNPAGSKSISGAPSSAGSDPEPTASNQPVPTIEQALKKAMRRAAA
jgi:hypothetical protein